MLSFDGQPLKNAYVSLFGQEIRFRQNTDSTSQFSFTVDKHGGYWLWLTGIHHKTLLIPLLVTEPLEFAVRLGAAGYKSDFDSVLVIGEFNDFSDEESAVLMRKQSDGTFIATIRTNSDTLGYQLLGVQKGEHPLAGTHAHRYAFDRERPLLGGKSGKYISVLNVENGAARMVFDPDELPRSEAGAKVMFKNSTCSSARIVSSRQELEKRREPYIEAIEAYRKAGKDLQAFKYDWSADRADLAKQIDAEPNQLVRQYLLLNYFHFGNSEEDSLMARRVFEEIPPASMIWSLEWGSPGNTFFTVAHIASQPQVAKVYAQQVIEEHADPAVRAPFLFYALSKAHQAGEAELTSRYYTHLMDEHGDTFYARMAKARYGPSRNIITGKPVPEFAVASLGDSTKAYTHRTFRGKVYLIDFWAVWCGPCVAEMKNLHKAYDKYKDKGFTILSLSFDRRLEDVIEFHRKKWPLPGRTLL
ncbi:MAG: redoxin family protein [Candidatus Latescibacteria bacterium]|nr:redoxin family protein [Candidatus Latescibacterota bacterium]NIO56886.1 redoxin family protein [Candidatus Latescibacterota bacterium]